MSLEMMNVNAEANRFNPRPVTNYWTTRGFGVRYPSPFFDVAQQFLPDNVHQLMLWCRFYFLTQPILNVACQKMAEYPVTPIVWETEDNELRKVYKGVEDMLRFRQFQVEIGLDYNVYGNAFASVFFQLDKYLVCTKCKERYRASKNRSLYRWKGGRFVLHCSKCGFNGIAQQADVYPRNIRAARLVRWNPENVEIKHNEITGSSRYYYKLPRRVVNDVKLGDPETIETLPAQFLEAARTGRALVFHPDNFFHLKRPTIAQKDQGWGSPLLYPLLKDAFYLQVMKKAQESLLLEHVVPLRIVFPGPPTGGNDGPFGSYNLTNWKAKIDAEFSIWKRDHNYIPILPVNIGYQQVGGQARALILHQEFRIHAEQMLAGAGIPVEFVFGGLQWSSSNTSLRALENTFFGYNLDRHSLMRFVVDKISAHMQWPRCEFRFEKFRMADDLQRAMFFFQLNQANKLSDRRLLEELGEDHEVETLRMSEELQKSVDVQRKTQMATANIQGAAQVLQTQYQAKAQEIMMRSQAELQVEMQQEGLAQPAVDPNAQGGAAGAPPGGQPAAGGQPAEGGDQVAQGLPEGATAYAENAGAPNESKAPTALAGMESPLAVGAGGVDMRYVAQRTAAYMRTVKAEAGEQAMHRSMEELMLANPPLYQMVVPLMQTQGSQVNPTDPMRAPITPRAQQRPAGRTVAG